MRENQIRLQRKYPKIYRGAIRENEKRKSMSQGLKVDGKTSGISTMIWGNFLSEI